MPSFHYQWDNTNALSNTNATGQRVSYRRKSTNGPFILTGFVPANPLTVTISSADTPSTLLPNTVYEFQQETLCSVGGPVPNTSGIVPSIRFSCVIPTIEFTETTSNISVNAVGTDISSIRFTLRKQSDNTIIYGTVSINVSGGIANTATSGLTQGTAYYWQVELVAIINGNEVISSSLQYIGSVCGPFAFTTNQTQQTTCPAVSGLTVNGSYELDWSNSPILNNTNVLGQRVVHRDRITGGAFLSMGVTPANDLSVSAHAAFVGIATKNRVQQFKVQTICTNGGPTDNTNGVQEGIQFECLPIATDTGMIYPAPTNAAYPFLVTDTDIVKARYTIKRQDNNAIVSGPTVCSATPNPGGPVKIACGLGGLTPQTDYYFEIELGAVVNGVDTYSPKSLCGNKNFTTPAGYSGRIGYSETDPFISGTTAPVGVTYFDPVLIMNPYDPITLLRTTTGYINLADKYIVLETDPTVATRTIVDNGGLGPYTIPGQEFSRSVTTLNKNYIVSNNPWALSTTNDFTFTASQT